MRRRLTPVERADAEGFDLSDWATHRVAVTRHELDDARRNHDREIEDAIRTGTPKAAIARAAGYTSAARFHNQIRRDRRRDVDDPKRRWPRIDADPP